MIAYENLVTSEFITKVKEVSARLKIDPSWLMIVMSAETGNTFSPSIRNASSGATGLIQFLKDTAIDLGTTTDQLARMSATAQLDYVEKYLKTYTGRMTDVYNVYLAIFSPKYIGKPDAQKVFVKGTKAYTQNIGLDRNKDGIITVADIKAFVSKRIPSGISAGSVTAEQAKLPVFILVIIILVLYYFLKTK